MLIFSAIDNLILLIRVVLFHLQKLRFFIDHENRERGNALYFYM